MTEMQVWIALYLGVGAFVLKGKQTDSVGAFGRAFAIFLWPLCIVLGIFS